MDEVKIAFPALPLENLFQAHRYAHSNKFCIPHLELMISCVDFILIESLKNFNQQHLSDNCVRGSTAPFLNQIAVNNLGPALSESFPLGLLLEVELAILVFLLLNLLLDKVEVDLVVFCENRPPKFIHYILNLIT